MEAAFDSFAQTINLSARGDWEYHGMDTIVIHTEPSFLAKFFASKQDTLVRYNMLIFKRLIDHSTPETLKGNGDSIKVAP